MGDTDRLVSQLRGLAADGYCVVICAEGAGSGSRMASVLREGGLVVSAQGGIDQPGLRIVVQPLERGFIYPALKLAVLAEGDVTGRRRAHRPARPGPGPPRRSSTT